jgi:hypothetical protein
MSQDEMDLLVSISTQFDAVPLTLPILRNQLDKLDGCIRGGIESARRLKKLLNLLPENSPLRREYFQSQKVLMAANPRDTGYRGDFVFMSQDEMDLLVSISTQFDAVPLTLRILRNLLDKLDGHIRGGLESAESYKQLFKSTGGRRDHGKALQ